jgi:uncharacterized protein (TIGR03382 family)
MQVGTSSRTDASGDDDSEIAGGELTVRLGAVAAGTSRLVSFRVTVDSTTVARTIENLGVLRLRGAQAGSGSATMEMESSSPAGPGPTRVGVVLATEGDAGAGDGGALDMGTAADGGAIDSGSSDDAGVAGRDAAAADSGAEDGDEEDCDCSAASGSSPPVAWALLIALALVRRRRS